MNLYATKYNTLYGGHSIPPGGVIELTDAEAEPLLAQGLISALPLAGDGVTTTAVIPAEAETDPHDEAIRALSDASFSAAQNLKAAEAALAEAAPNQKGNRTAAVNRAKEISVAADKALDEAMAAKAAAEKQ